MANTAPGFLFMTTGDENKTSLVSDLNVYTRNRHIRLWKSSKLGSNRYLQNADENEHATTIPDCISSGGLLTNCLKIDMFRDIP